MIYCFSIVSYNLTDIDKGLMKFKIDGPPLLAEGTSFPAKWSSSESRAEPWTREVFHPVVTRIRGGRAPDFMKVGMHRFKFASMRAIEIMERHGVNMQTFPASVQLKKNEPPVDDAYMLYRLLDIGPVIDLEKTGALEQWAFKDPVPTEFFLRSDSVMMRDEKYKSKVFIKQSLKDDFEQAGLLGWDFMPFDQVEVRSYLSKKPVQTASTSALPTPAPGVADNNIQAREFTTDEQQEIHKAQLAAARLLGVELTDDPKSIVEALAEEIDRLPRASLSEQELVSRAFDYGSLYGEQICRQHGWVWRRVQYPQNDQLLIGVVPPDYAYIVFPIASVYRFLTEPDLTNTLILLFNMLGSEDSLSKPRQKNGFRGLM